MSNTPIAQIAVSTIKGTEKQNIYPKTIDRAVLTTDKEGNEDTLDNVLIKGIDINGETVTPDENGVVSVPIATLVAGDKATRIIDDNIATKQIYRGTVIDINGVPAVLAVGAYCFNTATKKLYVGDSNSQPVEVAKPDDFIFIDTASGTTYRCDGTTLHNIATNLDLRAGDDLEAFADESAGQVSVRLKDKTGDNHSRKIVWLRPKEGYVYPDSCIILLQGYYDGTNCTANNITKAATISTTALGGDPNGIVRGLKDNKIYAYTFDGSTYTLYTSWAAKSVELKQDLYQVGNGTPRTDRLYTYGAEPMMYTGGKFQATTYDGKHSLMYNEALTLPKLYQVLGLAVSKVVSLDMVADANTDYMLMEDAHFATIVIEQVRAASNGCNCIVLGEYSECFVDGGFINYGVIVQYENIFAMAVW